MEWTLVTGGSKRLGRDICQTLAKKGYRILIHYNTSLREATELKNELPQSEIVQGDFSSKESVAAFIKNLEPYKHQIKALIHNVGNYIIDGPFSNVEEWKSLFETNLFAPVQITNALIDPIKKHKGKIVLIGSTGLAPFRADTYSTAYSCSKLALFGYMRTLAKELAPDGVMVNMVSPGMIDNAVDIDLSILPMKKAATTQDIADAVQFFLDPKNGYITGQNLEVAGALKL